MSVAFGLLTRHVNPGDDTNDDTDFVALSIDKYAIARFINSYNDETWFGGLHYHTPKKKLLKDSELFLQGNLYAGIVHGYKDHLPDIGGFTPVPLPTVGIGYKRFAIEFMYFPSPKGGVFSSALRIDLSWRKPRVSHDSQISEPVTP